jgi:hypothetical protein
VIDLSGKALADEQHRVALIDQLGIAPEDVMAVGISDQPAAGDTRSHGIPSRLQLFAASLS